MSNFQVVLDDLGGLSSRFAQQASVYQALVPAIASWSGDAKQAFLKAWTPDSIRVGGVGAMASEAGKAISDLGDALEQLENNHVQHGAFLRRRRCRALRSCQHSLARSRYGEVGVTSQRREAGQVGSARICGVAMKFGEVADAYHVKLPAELDFMKDIPVLDIAACAVSAEFGAQDDGEKGWSPTTAHVTNYTAAAVGVGAGVAMGALAAAAAPVEALIVAGVGAAVLAGSVGMYATNTVNDIFHENWSNDIHGHGVIAGIGHGIASSFSNGGSDTWNTAKSVGSTVESLWKSVF